MGVGHLRRLVLSLHHEQLSGIKCGGRRHQWPRAHLNEEIPYRALRHLPDELTHEREPAAGENRALLRLDIAGDHPHQRRLSGAIRPNEGCRRALGHPERHVIEQHPAVGQRVGHMLDIDVTH